MTELPFHDDTLKGAWDALCQDLGHDDDMPSLRQAFRDGAALILARLLARGEGDLPQDDIHVAMIVAAWLGKPNPDWSRRRRDCVLAGALAMQSILSADIPLVEVDRQMEFFWID